MSKQLTIEKFKVGNQVAILRLNGTVEQDGAAELRGVCDWLRRQDYIHLVINFSEVTFVASSGAGALIILSQELEMLDGSLQIVELSDASWRVVKALNLDDILTIRSTENEATDSLKATGLTVQSVGPRAD
jgi:anti-sigma B factor antagonist